MKKLLAFISVLLFMTSCSKFHDGGGSVWQGGLWILPILTTLGAAFFGYKAYKSSKGGSNVIEGGAITNKEGGNVPIWQLGYFYFAVGLLIATIVIVIMVNGDK